MSPGGFNVRGSAFVAVGVQLLVGGWAHPAEAQSRGSVLVLRLEHTGLPDDRVPSLERAMRGGIRRAMPRYAMLPAPKIELAALQRAAGCVQDGRGCLVGIGRTLGATLVVRVRLAPTPTALDLEVQGVWTRSGRAIRYDAELGPLGDESPAELSWHIDRAFGRTSSEPVGRIELVPQKPTDTLDGAEVRLDGEVISAEALATVKPGERRLELLQDGFESFVWVGRVRPGRTTRIAVQRTPREGESPVEVFKIVAPTDATAPETTTEATASPGGPRFVATWILGSATLVAASASTALAVTVLKREEDAEEQGLDCEGMDRDTDTCSAGRRQATLTTVSWAVTAGLAAATVTALFLEWPASSDDVQVGVGFTKGGASAALRLTFP